MQSLGMLDTLHQANVNPSDAMVSPTSKSQQSQRFGGPGSRRGSDVDVDGSDQYSQPRRQLQSLPLQLSPTGSFGDGAPDGDISSTISTMSSVSSMSSMSMDMADSASSIGSGLHTRHYSIGNSVFPEPPARRNSEEALGKRICELEALVKAHPSPQVVPLRRNVPGRSRRYGVHGIYDITMN